MGVFMFIDGPALVCGWVNFLILRPHTPVQTKLNPPLPGLMASIENVKVSQKRGLGTSIESFTGYSPSERIMKISFKTITSAEIYVVLHLMLCIIGVITCWSY